MCGNRYLILGKLSRLENKKRTLKQSSYKYVGPNWDMFSYCSTGVSSQTIAPKEVYKNFTKKEHGLCNLYGTETGTGILMKEEWL